MNFPQLGKRSCSLVAEARMRSPRPHVDAVQATLLFVLAPWSLRIARHTGRHRHVTRRWHHWPGTAQEDVMLPLTPNHLLLGKASIETPDMEFTEEDKYSARLAYVEQVYEAWWKKWIQDVLPTRDGSKFR